MFVQKIVDVVIVMAWKLDFLHSFVHSDLKYVKGVEYFKSHKDSN